MVRRLGLLLQVLDPSPGDGVPDHRVPPDDDGSSEEADRGGLPAEVSGDAAGEEPQHQERAPKRQEPGDVVERHPQLGLRRGARHLRRPCEVAVGAQERETAEESRW